MRQRYILILLSLLIGFNCSAQRFSVKVVGISDGDTFTAINRDNLQLKFRIDGIDAPEKKQAYGAQAKEYLSSLIFGENIEVDVQKQDGWGRYVAMVYAPSGQDVALLMLKAGYAWQYVKYNTSQIYSNAQYVAKANRIGLWKDSSPIAPWDFRASNKK